MEDNTKFMEWLEGAVRSIFEMRPKSMALVSVMESGETMTAYFQANAQDKAIFAHHINSDIVQDLIEANADRIKAILDGTPSDGTCFED